MNRPNRSSRLVKQKALQCFLDGKTNLLERLKPKSLLQLMHYPIEDYGKLTDEELKKIIQSFDPAFDCDFSKLSDEELRAIIRDNS